MELPQNLPLPHSSAENAGLPPHGSIERHALFSLLAATSLAALVVWLLLSAMTEVSRLSDRLIHTGEVIHAVEVLKVHLTDVETGERGYLITGSPEYLEPYHSALIELENHRQRLAALRGKAPAATVQAHQLERLIHAKLEIARANVAARGQGWEAARSQLMAAGGKQKMDAIRQLLDTIADASNQEFEALRRQRQAAVALLEAEIVLAMLLLVAGLGLFHRRLLNEMRRRREQEERAQHLAMHDSLTGLPNRRALIVQLEQVLKRCARHQRLAAILFLDLNGFKAVNDRYGHQAGDELLRQVAQRLTRLMRATDLVARLGGDEFVVLSEEIGEDEDVCRIIGKITREIAAPFTLEAGLVVTISTSAGVAIYPEDGEELDGLLSRADSAMYAAKQSGSNCFCSDVRRNESCVLNQQATVRGVPLVRA
jgi:diguanylate cyclase (GGDEF)-like protein